MIIMNDKPKNTPPSQPEHSGAPLQYNFFNWKIGRIEYALWLGGSGVVCLAMFFFVIPLLHYLADLRFIVPIVLFSILSSLGAIWRLNSMGIYKKLVRYIITFVYFGFPSGFVVFLILFIILDPLSKAEYTPPAFVLSVKIGLFITGACALIWLALQILLLSEKENSAPQEIE